MEGLNEAVSGVRGDRTAVIPSLADEYRLLPQPPTGVEGDLMLSADAGELRLPMLSAGLDGSIEPLLSSTVSCVSFMMGDVMEDEGIEEDDSFFSSLAYQGKSGLALSE